MVLSATLRHGSSLYGCDKSTSQNVVVSQIVHLSVGGPVRANNVYFERLPSSSDAHRGSCTTVFRHARTALWFRVARFSRTWVNFTEVRIPCSAWQPPRFLLLHIVTIDFLSNLDSYASLDKVASSWLLQNYCKLYQIEWGRLQLMYLPVHNYRRVPFSAISLCRFLRQPSMRAKKVVEVSKQYHCQSCKDIIFMWTFTCIRSMKNLSHILNFFLWQEQLPAR